MLERIAEVAGAGGLRGNWAPSVETVDRLEAAVAEVPTEASAQAVRCARGDTGTTAIRDGRRSVELSPIGGLTYFFDPAAALASAARLATTVIDAHSLLEAHHQLRAIGVQTELGLESGT